MMIGVNAEELVLVCVPPSISLGILLSCVFGRKKDILASFDEKEVHYDA
jgi:hypothetical protein